MRASTRAFKFKGIDAKLAEANGRVVNQFTGGDGTEKTNSVADYLLDATIPAEIDPITFGVVKSTFKSRGANERYATALALLTIDAARVQSVSAMTLVGKLSIDKTTLPTDTLYIVNLLSESTFRIGSSVTITNTKSLKANYIRP